ncbi:MAG: hypothetical protein JXB14_05560, partial [Candidatus Altiarchaeota archaeon]|nr:hypothetical protein [Candidatus Altiarchaeota archaeon]
HPTTDSPLGKNPDGWGLKILPEGRYRVREGMQQDEVKRFLRGVGDSVLKGESKTSADRMYHMPGDTELRAYFFMQCIYGETSEPVLSDGLVPVRNGVAGGEDIKSSFLGLNASRDLMDVDEKTARLYRRCNGENSIGDLVKEFERGFVERTLLRLLKESYIVLFQKKFLRHDR